MQSFIKGRYYNKVNGTPLNTNEHKHCKHQPSKNLVFLVTTQTDLNTVEPISVYCNKYLEVICGILYTSTVNLTDKKATVKR